jgi:hypothetical protein
VEREQLACGSWALIEHGIRAFEREHGEKPFALVLHPEHFDEFCNGTGSDETILDGVSIIQSPRFTMPTLIDLQGNPFEI